MFPHALVHLLDQPQAQTVGGEEPAHGGLFYPKVAGGIRLRCASIRPCTLTVHVLTHHDVLHLSKVDNQWQACQGEQVLASAPVVVLAAPPKSNGSRQPATCRSNAFAGKITQLLETQNSAALQTVVCAEGYIAPGRLGEHTLGASFDFNNEDLTTTPEGHQGTPDLLHEISPALAQNWV